MVGLGLWHSVVLRLCVCVRVFFLGGGLDFAHIFNFYCSVMQRQSCKKRLLQVLENPICFRFFARFVFFPIESVNLKTFEKYHLHSLQIIQTI